jgi:OFA family oxalate/formate antiporter-like MFS transporter
MKRIFALLGAVLIQTSLGGVYAWSAFVPSLKMDYGLTTGQTQFIFGLSIASFTATMVFAGRLLARWESRRVAMLGGVLFFCGYLISAASRGHYFLLLGGYSLVGGASIGFGYAAALATAIQWFPKHKGLVTGVAVGGFGAGAVLLSALTTEWLNHGWTVLEIFRAIGWIYGAAVCLGAFLLFRPLNSQDGAEMSLGVRKHLLKDPVFRALAVGMFCGTFAGLLIIGNLKPIGMAGGLPPDKAVWAISCFALGNALGRISWGWLWDRYGYKTIPLSLLFLGLSLIVLLPARQESVSFSGAAFLVGFGFGASFVMYAAQVASHYGMAEVGRIYPLLFLAYGVSGIIGPSTGGLLYDLTNSHAAALAVSVMVILVGVYWTWRARVFIKPIASSLNPCNASRLTAPSTKAYYSSL